MKDYIAAFGVSFTSRIGDEYTGTDHGAYELRLIKFRAEDDSRAKELAEGGIKENLSKGHRNSSVELKLLLEARVVEEKATVLEALQG